MPWRLEFRHADRFDAYAAKEDESARASRTGLRVW
jgi:hypothetical protein